MHRGEILAQIDDPITGSREAIQATQCGVVHDLNVGAKVDRGDDVVGVLEFTTCPERGRRPGGANVDTLENQESDRIELRASEVFGQARTLRI